MAKKITALILALLTFVLLFTSCSGGEGEDLYYPLYQDPVSLDPQIAKDNASKIVVFNCFEGLVKLNEDGKIIPGVAESWEISSDGLVYTFHLRKGAKWYMSDYAKELLPKQSRENFNYNVTADDFVYGLRRAFNSLQNPATDSRLYAIKNSYDVMNREKYDTELGVTALSDSVLKIELSEPHDDFLNALTQSAAMPCREEFFLATKGRYGLDPEKVIYNGPFYLYSWSAGSNLVLLKNENYVGESEVKPSGVYLYINNDLKTRVDKLSDGTYDACPLSIRQKETVSNKKVTYTDFNNSTWGFSFNCEDELLKNLNLRNALTSSLDTHSIPLPESCEGYAMGLVPEVCMSAGENYRSRAGKVKFHTLNEKKAKVYLEKAFKELEIDTAQLDIICLDTFENSVKVAVQSWQKALGVDINFIIEPLNESELNTRLNNKEYCIAFSKITAENDSALGFLGTFKSDGSSNIFNLKSKKYDEFLGSADKNPSEEELFENCVKAEQYLIDMSVFLPAFTENSFLAQAKGVSGIYSIEAGGVPIFYNGIRT